MNSPGSRISRCHSTNCRSQAMRWSSSAGPRLPSLYFQCAAMPSSAMRCISSVRICTSNAAARPDHRGMQRLVEVRPGDGDEVLDAARDGVPLVVDDAERRVAVLHRIGDDAQRQQVVDLVQADLLPLHLLVDRVGALHPAVDAGRESLRGAASLDRALRSP